MDSEVAKRERSRKHGARASGPIDRLELSDARGGNAPNAAETKAPAYFVQSLARGLDVVRAFGADARAMTLGQVAAKTGMSRAAARRYLLTLRDLGFVEMQGPYFRLKPRILELGYAYLSSLELWQVVQPILENLVATVRESSSVSVLDSPDIVYVARVQVKRIFSSAVSVGTRLPAFATAMGRVMLAGATPAELDDFFARAELTKFTDYTVASEAKLRQIIARIRTEGYAIVDQELEFGLRSIAVPIKDRAGKTIAGINISSHAARIEVSDMIARYLPHLRAASAEVTSHLP